MALTHKAKRKWAALILLVGLPIYIILATVLATTVVGWFGRPVFLLQLAIYVGLGVLWILPFKKVFLGVGQADPEAENSDQDRP
ncbi:DUF2842 domain-containing protein [Cognatishimia sp. SS12]|uniref:DUF2842 domain-containing protein n=1 Tax=Cognatishimia sp. SS12 TaxID=2979465 RepID=UPI00232DA362|nr:DUF2842 domain-containing protein [Cognatishimia sp. SS12]MDC0736796.1 DUF2842 domain-containing protein [Cognatishimia sp. SS12]